MKITFEGETLYDIAAQMQLALDQLDMARGGEAAPEPGPEPGPEPQHDPGKAEAPLPTDEAPAKRKPGRPKKTTVAEEDPAPATGEEPQPEPEPEPEPEPDFDQMRSSAITKLMGVYNRGGPASVAVKGVLKEFGVTKFSEVPDEKLKDLLTRAVELETTTVAA
jgi:hypothetical protein